jgi:hypothetical protein
MMAITTNSSTNVKARRSRRKAADGLGVASDELEAATEDETKAGAQKRTEVGMVISSQEVTERETSPGGGRIERGWLESEELVACCVVDADIANQSH